ncbi:MAG: SCO family protein [Planctomycetota bacterium]
MFVLNASPIPSLDAPVVHGRCWAVCAWAAAASLLIGPSLSARAEVQAESQPEPPVEVEQPMAAPTPLHNPVLIPEAQEKQKPVDLVEVGVDRKLGNVVDSSLDFRDSAGQPVTLGDYLADGKPVVLVLGYYRCPQICSIIINAISDTAAKLGRDSDWVPGGGYRIVMVSIDPRETPAIAAEKKAEMVEQMREAAGDEAASTAEAGWAFLTGPKSSITALADSVGFRYTFVQRRNEYAHPASLIFLTDAGVVSNYLHGLSYPVQDVKLALMQASDNELGSLWDRFVLQYCYVYDAEEKKWVVHASNIMKASGLVVLAVLIGAILLGFRYERKRRRLTEAEDLNHPPADPASGSGHRPVSPAGS